MNRFGPEVNTRRQAVSKRTSFRFRFGSPLSLETVVYGHCPFDFVLHNGQLWFTDTVLFTLSFTIASCGLWTLSFILCPSQWPVVVYGHCPFDFVLHNSPHIQMALIAVHLHAGVMPMAAVCSVRYSLPLPPNPHSSVPASTSSEITRR